MPRNTDPGADRVAAMVKAALAGNAVTYVPQNLHRLPQLGLLAPMGDLPNLTVIAKPEIDSMWTYLENNGVGFDRVIFGGTASAIAVLPAVHRFAPYARVALDTGADGFAADHEFTPEEQQVLEAADEIYAADETGAQLVAAALAAPDDPKVHVVADEQGWADAANRFLVAAPAPEEKSAALVLHLHLFKNAGSSVDAVLKNYFGSNWRSFDLVDPQAVLGQTELRRIRDAHPKLQSLSSHQVRPPLPPDADIVPILFLRDPVARLVSVFDYFHSTGLDNASGDYVRAFDDLREFAVSMVANDNGLVINFQARFLGAYASKHPHATLRLVNELEAARAFCRGLPFVGSVASYGDSIKVFESQISEHYPDFVFEHRFENRSSKPKVPARERLGEELTELLEQKNWADAVLLSEFAPDGLADWVGPEPTEA